MIRVAFIGWRGMVGSVLMERMVAEEDFKGFEPTFATTSQVGQPGPGIGLDIPPLKDAFDLEMLSDMDIILTCQGSGYTKKVYPKLRESGWGGYWIDAASALRMEKDSVIVLDPVNRGVIDNALAAGTKDFIGGNCTVSCMLMGIGSLFEKELVEWLTTMTYQAASGAGAKNMRELIEQMGVIGGSAKPLLDNPASSIAEIDRKVTEIMAGSGFPSENFGAPLAGSVIPWIDAAMENGQTREEWKGFAETNKILQTDTPIPVDGLCVRVGAMRCHSQAINIKLSGDIPIDEIEGIIGEASQWTKVVPNTKEETVKHLSPASTTGTLEIPVGRIRKLTIGKEYLGLFTVGDQLLWGAAEPLRRMLKITLEHLI